MTRFRNRLRKRANWCLEQKLVQGARAVRWGVARRILIAWILTIPMAGLLAALSWVVLNALGAP